jgi:hypothetical protein
MSWRSMGEWICSSTILDHGTRCWAVSFIPRQLYTGGKSPRRRLDRRLGGPQNFYGRCGEEKNPLLYQHSNPGHPASSYTDWAISVPKLYTVITLTHIKQTQRYILRIPLPSSVYNQKLKATKKKQCTSVFEFRYLVWGNAYWLTGPWKWRRVGEQNTTGKYIRGKLPSAFSTQSGGRPY